MQSQEKGSHRYYTRSRVLLEGEQSNNKQSDTMGDRHAGSPPRGHRTEDEETREFFRTMATGQQQVAQALQALTTMMERMNPPNRNNQEPEDNRSVANIPRPHRVATCTVDKPSRPNFLAEEPEDVARAEVELVFVDNVMMVHDEWSLLPPDVRQNLNFDQFMRQKWEVERNRQERRPRFQHRDLEFATSKLTLPYYDGSGAVTTRSWIHKLDTYFTLRPMIERDAIKFATLHLDGTAHEWWHNGLITLQHDEITTYQEFADLLVERFDKKDPESYFRELAQLKQTGNLEVYVSEFLKLSCMVNNMSNQRLVVLFIEGLMEPLRGWVKAFDPPTLLLAIKKARSMDVITTQNKFGSKGSTSFKANRNFSKGKEKSNFKNDYKPKPAAPPLDRETLNDLRQKKLCFYCKGPYDANHDCPLRPKGRANRVMWAYYEDSESDHEGQPAGYEDLEAEDDTQGPLRLDKMDAEVDEHLKEALLTSIQQEGSFRMRGVLAGQKVITLLDTGATHNFIDARLVEKRGIQTEEFEGIRVRVANGYTLKCNRMITQLPLRVNNYEFKTDFYVVQMGNTDLVLGMKWLHELGKFTLDLQEMEMSFTIDEKTHVLKAIKDSNFRMITLRRMERLVHHDQTEWAAKCMIMPIQQDAQKVEYHPNIQILRTKHSKVFSDIPSGRPPDRGFEHIIELEEGAKPVMITPYRHPKRLKDEIEKTI
ncbi:uncharacterized protein LOC131857345 [Cryptomeria japonica]|uniref:uncharacterized protein LOC131857345 n=1 Tax=Cryptomeria japonica TaxID=3369 RepID=UPI0027DA502A|nr:uncharacterized protein LOC131857345 [Cryptomeria japonica]